jgi:short-subunit dehydrogenase
MSINLNNKTILVTGSTDGLGKKLAIELSKLGANVIVHGKDHPKVDDTVKELQSINKNRNYRGIVCDLNDPKSIENKFVDIKELDILVNNAGIWQEGQTDKLSSERLIEVMNVNLTAPLVITKTLLNTLKSSEYGQILNVVSVAGVEIPTGYFHTIYSASKFGLQAFSEALEKENDNKNIRVMGYYPGGMYTKLFKKAGIDYKEKEEWMFDPQESVEAIIFMLTRDPKVNIKRMDLINHLQR